MENFFPLFFSEELGLGHDGKDFWRFSVNPEGKILFSAPRLLGLETKIAKFDT